MLRPLIEKEVKDLIRDPRIWVPILISFLIFPALGYAQSSLILRESVEAFTRELSVEVQYIGQSPDLDAFSSILSNFFALSNIKIAPKGSFPEKADALLIINATSIRDLLSGGRVSAYLVYTLSASTTMGEEVTQRVSRALTEASRTYLLSAMNLAALANSIIAPSITSYIPYIEERKAIIGGIGPGDIAFLLIAALMIPIIVTIIIFLILQYSATSMAIENEEKTLEILFSMPIPRWSITMAKLTASAIIGGLSVLGFVTGFIIYQNMIMESVRGGTQAVNITIRTPITGASIPAEVQDLLRTYLGNYSVARIVDLVMPSLSSIAILAVYIIEVTILAGVLGIIIGGMSSDVRMAYTISGSLTPPIIIFAIAAFYLDPQRVPGWLLLTNPLTGTILYSRMAFSGLSPGPEIYIYLAVSGAVVAVLIYLSGRMLSLETLERARRGAWGIFRRRRIT